MHEATIIGAYEASVKDDRKDSIAGYETNIIEARVFTCIPGTTPVNVPISDPARHAAITNIIISGPTTD